MDKPAGWDEFATTGGEDCLLEGESDDEFETFWVKLMTTIGCNKILSDDSVMAAKTLEPMTQI